jgi:1,4-dihydroxy-2-naphthoyl-CoA hydrolase
MFKSANKVRMHDTDMAGILYFPRLFRFAHDALEDFVETLGLSFNQVFHREPFVFVIVHAEADYLKSLRVGDPIMVHLSIEALGTTSFTVGYKIFKDEELMGTAQTVHVTVDTVTRTKIPIPSTFKALLAKHLNQSDEESTG